MLKASASKVNILALLKVNLEVLKRHKESSQMPIKGKMSSKRWEIRGKGIFAIKRQ